MRLHEVERGENFGRRLLIGLISRVSGMRLPDAARVAFYHTEFFGGPLGAWTHATMRGASEWSVYERELMAAQVAMWNSCTFCIGAHGAIAAKSFGKAAVNNVLAKGDQSILSPGLRATLTFLEKLTRMPKALTGDDAQAVLQAGNRRVGAKGSGRAVGNIGADHSKAGGDGRRVVEPHLNHASAHRYVRSGRRSVHRRKRWRSRRAAGKPEGGCQDLVSTG